MGNAIITCTDNTLPDDIATACRHILTKEARGAHIICVSQEPVYGFGENVVVGQIGRSWNSLYKQLLAGVAVAETEWVVIAEHDCCYSYEYLSYQPDDPNVFWYNSNCYLVEGPRNNHPELFGMFSYLPRRLALSQLICRKDLLRQAIDERLSILAKGATMDREYLGCGEPGVMSDRALKKAAREAASGRPTKLEPYLKDYLHRYNHKVFKTEIPNLDIRWGGNNGNFTGPRRGKKRVWELPYWGKFADVMEGRWAL